MRIHGSFPHLAALLSAFGMLLPTGAAAASEAGQGTSRNNATIDFVLSHGAPRSVAVAPIEPATPTTNAHQLHRLPSPTSEAVPRPSVAAPAAPPAPTVSQTGWLPASDHSKVELTSNGALMASERKAAAKSNATTSSTSKTKTPAKASSPKLRSWFSSSRDSQPAPTAKPKSETSPPAAADAGEKPTTARSGSGNFLTSAVARMTATSSPKKDQEVVAKTTTPATPPVAEVAKPTSDIPATLSSGHRWNQSFTGEFAGTDSSTTKQPDLPPSVQFAAAERKVAAVAQQPTSADYALLDATDISGNIGPLPASQPPTILYRPAVIAVNQQGQTVLRPDVRVAGNEGPYMTVAETAPETVPTVAPETAEVVVPNEWSAPIVEDPYQGYMTSQVGCAPAQRLGPGQEAVMRTRAVLNGPRSPQPGIGVERVMHAVSFIDTTQPMNNFRLRFDLANNLRLPDRSEYVWAKIDGGRGVTNKGGIGESQVDYQDIRMYLEMGGEKFSVGTDIPIRVIDPAVYDNTAGLGDISITPKIQFLDGDYWQLAHLFRVYVPSGDVSEGLGTGHASIEPGFAWRYRWSGVTYLHGDLKFWVPLGGDELHSGEVLNYGIGMSHVLRDSDCYAMMGSIEFVGWSFVDGQATNPGVINPALGNPEFVDPEGVFHICPGVRWVWDNGGDCGIKELGIFGGLGVSEDPLYESLLRLEFRRSW